MTDDLRRWTIEIVVLSTIDDLRPCKVDRRSTMHDEDRLSMVEWKIDRHLEALDTNTFNRLRSTDERVRITNRDREDSKEEDRHTGEIRESIEYRCEL